MTSDITHRGGFLGFLTTIPGILTALAALVTAVGGVYLTNNSGPSPAPQPEITIINPGAMPEETISTTEQLDVASVTGTTGDSAVDQMINDCAAGFSDACTELLDMLSQECFEGYGLSCDVLYEVSPVGSDYEAYGATCGARFGPEYAGTCGAL